MTLTSGPTPARCSPLGEGQPLISSIVEAYILSQVNNLYITPRSSIHRARRLAEASRPGNAHYACGVQEQPITLPQAPAVPWPTLCTCEPSSAPLPAELRCVPRSDAPSVS